MKTPRPNLPTNEQEDLEFRAREQQKKLEADLAYREVLQAKYEKAFRPTKEAYSDILDTMMNHHCLYSVMPVLSPKIKAYEDSVERDALLKVVTDRTLDKYTLIKDFSNPAVKNQMAHILLHTMIEQYVLRLHLKDNLKLVLKKTLALQDPKLTLDKDFAAMVDKLIILDKEMEDPKLQLDVQREFDKVMQDLNEKVADKNFMPSPAGPANEIAGIKNDLKMTLDKINQKDEIQNEVDAVGRQMQESLKKSVDKANQQAGLKANPSDQSNQTPEMTSQQKAIAELTGMIGEAGSITCTPLSSLGNGLNLAEGMRTHFPGSSSHLDAQDAKQEQDEALKHKTPTPSPLNDSRHQGG